VWAEEGRGSSVDGGGRSSWTSHDICDRVKENTSCGEWYDGEEGRPVVAFKGFWGSLGKEDEKVLRALPRGGGQIDYAELGTVREKPRAEVREEREEGKKYRVLGRVARGGKEPTAKENLLGMYLDALQYAPYLFGPQGMLGGVGVGLFSRLEKEIGKLVKRGTKQMKASSLLKQLAKNTSREERSWTGVGKFLESKGDERVALGLVQRIASEGAIQLSEAVFGAPRGQVAERRGRLKEKAEDLTAQYNEGVLDFDGYQRAINSLDPTFLGDPKHSRAAYRAPFPTGRRYRESLVTLKPKGKSFLGPSAHDWPPDYVAWTRSDVHRLGEPDSLRLLHELQEDWAKEGREKGFGEESVPPTPFPQPKASRELGLKQFLLQALEDDVEKIGWVSGSAQMARWDVRNFFEAIEYTVDEGGNYRLELFLTPGEGGGSRSVGPWDEAKLRRNVDQEIADRIVGKVGEVGGQVVAGEPTPPTRYRLEGENLALGGRWAPQIYGGSPEDIAKTFPGAGLGHFATGQGGKEQAEVPSFFQKLWREAGEKGVPEKEGLGKLQVKLTEDERLHVADLLADMSRLSRKGTILLRQMSRSTREQIKEKIAQLSHKERNAYFEQLDSAEFLGTSDQLRQPIDSAEAADFYSF